jgi:exodeoxyribonuclease V gamma subunit
MFVHRSNQSERLVDELCAVVRVPQRDPFAPELIAVQSKGMERWLALELSARLPLWANAQYPFPRRLLDQLFDLVLQEDPARRAPFAEHGLLWSIAARLPAHLHEPAFAKVARYLADDRDGALRIALSARIARVLDDYAVYRPELLRGWEQQRDREDAEFEAVLWRSLVAAHGREHRAARAERCVAALRAGAFQPDALPQRLCLFGISSMPPLQLELLDALAQHVETHLFLLSPSRKFFAELGRGSDEPGEDGGHPLLTSFGRLGRELQALLEKHTNYREDDRDLYVDPVLGSGHACLLHTLQSDMLALENRGTPGAEPRLPIAEDDGSLSIHVCHGPMREVEVLHDQLLALLQDQALQPHQIVVMAPEIETYAPVIEAVFGAHSGRPAIPFSVADRRTRSTHALIDALFALLEALRGRMTAGAVLDLLGLDTIRERFAVALEELGRVRDWVEESGVRWGVDAQHRIEEGQPAFAENTWRFGLDRLFLGLALAGHEQTLYEQTLPLDDVEGSDGELLGKLSALCERLFAARRIIAAPHTLADWQRDIGQLLADFMSERPDTAAEREAITSALAGLREDGERAGFRDPLDLRSLLEQLELRLDERLPARGLLARGVTFCQLVPMRSIPFEVVCLLGMNDDAFPRPSAPLSFDRMAEHGKRRPGDRSTRDDDRYMFLEALLCARKRLLISYVGRGIHDNRSRPPSVVVGDLIDAVARGFEPEGSPREQNASQRRAAIVARLSVEHRLQAWSPRYFTCEPREPREPRLWSYAQNACRAARALAGPRSAPAAIFAVRAPHEPDEEITLEELVRFIGAPVRTFAQRKLGLYLGDDLTPPPAREPVELDALERWQLKDQLLRAGLRGQALDELLPALRASGQLPLGSVGQVAYRQLRSTIEPLAQRTLAVRAGDPLPPLAIALERDGVRLTGTIGELWSNARVEASASKPGRRFELSHYVRHVVMCAQLQQTPLPGYPRHSVVLSAEGPGDVHESTLAPPPDALELLQQLLDLYALGQTTPLPFEYLVSRAYAQARYLGKPEDAALGKAAAAFAQEFDSPDGRGGPDAYVQRIFPTFAELRDANVGRSFTEVADAIFAPMLTVRAEPSR